MSHAPVPKTPVVIDASVGVKWYVPELHDAEALALLDERFDRHVPAHFYIEIASTVWKKVVQRGELSEDDGREMLTKVGRVRATIHPTGTLLDPAFEIALATRRTVYDCLYIALAERLDCVAVTADERLYNATRGGPYAARVHWVGDPLGTAPPPDETAVRPRYVVVIRGRTYAFADPEHPGWARYLKWVDRKLNPWYTAQEHIADLPDEFRKLLVGVVLDMLVENPEGPPIDAPERERLNESLEGRAELLWHGMSVVNPGLTRAEFDTLIGGLTLPEFYAIRVGPADAAWAETTPQDPHD